MKKICLPFLAIISLFLLLPVTAVEANAPAALTIIVPAYFYPDKNGLVAWNRLISAASRVPIVAIVNPESGPGDHPDENYLKLMGLLEKSRVFPIGYIHTAYAKRPLQDVEVEVDKWIHFYPGIRGIFFDEQASEAKHAPYYEELFKYVRKTRSLDMVVTNPGTACSENYFSQHAADVVCLHEEPGEMSTESFPNWTEKYPSTGVLILPYQVKGITEMQTWFRLAQSRKFQYIYVTDASGNNPWDQLPSYWDQEVDAVQKLDKSEGN